MRQFYLSSLTSFYQTYLSLVRGTLNKIVKLCVPNGNNFLSLQRGFTS